MQRLISVSEANNLIQDGKVLHIAGHERALSQLSCGAWVGGTTPYFLTDRGGMVERNKVYVNEIPTSQAMVKTLWVGVDELEDCLGFRPVNGFSVVIIPAQSPFHFAYALAANTASHLFDSAIVGWVSGAHLDDLGHHSPKVFDGFTGKSSDQDMIVMQVELPDNLSAKVGMINLFEPGQGDEIVFADTGFSATTCWINGKADNIYDYVVREAINQELPLMFERPNKTAFPDQEFDVWENVGFKSLDAKTRSVEFYAPVQKGVIYRQAKPLQNYRQSLIAATRKINFAPTFSCHCVLNYLYAELEGNEPISFSGPATFGEIANTLHTQSLAYLRMVLS